MGDDHAGRLLGLLGLEDQLVDHVAHDRVEPGGRLVVEHHLGVERQGPGQADPLPLAAGELGRLLPLEARRAGRPPGAARRRSCRIVSSSQRWCSRRPKATLSKTVRLSNSAAIWNRKPNRSRILISSLLAESGDVAAVEPDAALAWGAAGR